MYQLLLETATDVCSVAVAHGSEIRAEVTAEEVHQHASHLTLFIERALLEAGVDMQQLDRLLLSDGPGSYTSLRVGAATAKGLCLALPGLELYTVPTLTALAAAVSEAQDKIMATINSRKGEVYGRLFGARDLQPITETLNVQLTDPRWRGKLLDGAALGRIYVCGPGQERVRRVIENDNVFSFGEPLRVSATNLLLPAAPPQLQDPATYEPFYLNPPFVTRSRKKPLV